MTLAGAAVLGLLVGAALGGLGGGGAILAVPAMIFLLDQSAQAATTGSLLVVGLSALTGAAAHVRGGQVRWRLALGLGGLGVPGTW
ncbi:MAG TPA: TSUP family transporter, partial [Nocardioides sp.]|nr:TSUP family transporter [Nocardioides sp.]